MAQVSKRIGFLATGEELINADFPDTNSALFAQDLVDHSIRPGQRVIVGDQENDIEAAILYLLSHHEALIIIGGLGPTIDDRTRYALAKAIGRELYFDEASWQQIVDRLTRMNLEVPETNRQQALFPIGSQIIRNPNGTADACYLSFEGKDIFMLPGPPNECRPIFRTYVLPYWIKHHYSTPIYRHSWLLLGVSESKIASELEKWITTDSHCHLGYRAHYPYLDIKLWSNDSQALNSLSRQFDDILKPSLISKKNQMASDQLITYLKENAYTLVVNDKATYGHLTSTLHRPDTRTKLNFFKGADSPIKKDEILISIDGLEEYWQNPAKESQQTSLSIAFKSKQINQTIQRSIPIREDKTPIYAVELICWEILNLLGPIGHSSIAATT
jgi:molybdenum cofactor synthesis domain-containing protein